MNAKEFIIQSLTVTVGLLIFVIVVWGVLKIFTSEGFEALRLTNDEDVELDDLSDLESIDDTDDEDEIDSEDELEN